MTDEILFNRAGGQLYASPSTGDMDDAGEFSAELPCYVQIPALMNRHVVSTRPNLATLALKHSLRTLTKHRNGETNHQNGDNNTKHQPNYRAESRESGRRHRRSASNNLTSCRQRNHAIHPLPMR